MLGHRTFRTNRIRKTVGTLRTSALQIWALGAFFSVATIACGLSTGTNDDNYATESEYCRECQAILVECTSTSRDEAQFIQCRDQWQTCQNGRGLEKDACRNPSDTDACALCRGRMTTCVQTDGADTGKCEEEFGICKAYLITRGDVQQQCTMLEQVPPEIACGVCQKDVARCMSDVTVEDPNTHCSNQWDTCLIANALTADVCSSPAGQEACNLCTEQHAECEASEGANCRDGFDACAASIASGVECTLAMAPPGTGGGGMGGMGGAGGAGGGGAPDCTHHVCAEGVALEIGCGGTTCVEDVCAADAWCCTDQWDALCVSKAHETASCGC